jgi:hypothetical protein
MLILERKWENSDVKRCLNDIKGIWNAEKNYWKYES